MAGLPFFYFNWIKAGNPGFFYLWKYSGGVTDSEGGKIYVSVADFDSAHFLSGYTGKCSNIHGHRWHVEIEIESRKLEKNGQGRGMLVDFGDLKKDLRELADSMDHTLIYEENTLRPKTLEALDEEGFHLVKVPFRPTAENFSEYFFRKMEEKGYPVKRAVVYETPNNCAAYRETEEETEAVWL